MTSAERSLPVPEQEEFGYGKLFSILLRRWPWIVGALGVSLAVATYQASQEEPTYRSSMQLIVEPNFQEQLSAADLTPYQEQSGSDIDYATQLNLMRSDQFIEQAVARLHTDYPELDPKKVTSTFSLERLSEGKTETRIFQASYIAGDPELTQRFLEELKAVYLEYNETRQQQRLTRGLNHIDEQLTSTQESLQRSQNSLQQFRQNANLIDPSVQAQKVAETLTRVQEEQGRLEADVSALATQYEALEEQLQLAPNTALVASRLSQSDQVQALLDELQETELALADRQSLFTDADPTVQLLLEQRRNQIQVLQDTVGNIVRQPVEQLDPELLSYLQLGSVDISLVSDLLTANASLRSLSARRNSLQRQEERLRAELNDYPRLIAEYDRLQPEVEIERETLQRLLEEREQVTSELSREGFTWQVVEAPSRGRQLGPNPIKTIMLGGVVGTFLGGLLAFGREAMDTVVHTSDDLKRQVPLPLLGILPWLLPQRGLSFIGGRRETAPTLRLHPEIAESPLIQPILHPVFRESMDVIGNLLQLQHQDSCKAIAITSGLPEEGKTTVALGLAYSLARMSQRVLVIDADLRRSGLRDQLGLPDEQSLANYLVEGSEPKTAQTLVLGPVQLDVLPAGPMPPDPLLLLSSPRFQRLVARYREVYDVVLVDTPPVLGMADAARVGAVCDGIVLVTRLDRITQADLNEVVTTLSGFEVLGIVANGGKATSMRYGSYSDRSLLPTQ